MTKIVVDMILVTGGEGYIGSNFIDQNDDVKSYDIKRGYDVRDRRQFLEAVKGCSGIVHLAAESHIDFCEANPESAYSTNVYGTGLVSEVAACLGIGLVYASSFACVERANIYGKTKWLGERLVLAAGGVVIRLANVYGGLNPRADSVIEKFREAKRRGIPATVYGDGMQSRDFIHVEDVCRAFVMGLNAKSGTYEASTGIQTRIIDLVDMLEVDYTFKPKPSWDVDFIPSNPSRWLPRWKPGIKISP